MSFNQFSFPQSPFSGGRGLPLTKNDGDSWKNKSNHVHFKNAYSSSSNSESSPLSFIEKDLLRIKSVLVVDDENFSACKAICSSLVSLNVDDILENFAGGSTYLRTELGVANEYLCRSMGACIFEASSTVSTFHSYMYTREYIQDDVAVVIKKISKMHFDEDLDESALKQLFFISKSLQAPRRIVQIWFPEGVRPPKWAIERIEKHASKKAFESFIPKKDSSLRYAPYRGKRLYFRRTGNKDDDAKATEDEDEDEEDDATNGVMGQHLAYRMKK